MIQREQVHQVNTDLIGGLSAVRVQIRQKTQIFLLIKQPYRGGGIAYINRQQHPGDPLSLAYRFYYGITTFRCLQVFFRAGILSRRKAVR